jgi:hypothetical protein
MVVLELLYEVWLVQQAAAVVQVRLESMEAHLMAVQVAQV